MSISMSDTVRDWVPVPRRGVLRIAIVLALAGCYGEVPRSDPRGTQEIADALAELPDATVLMYAENGVPQYIVGNLGKVDVSSGAGPDADSNLRDALPLSFGCFASRTRSSS